MRPILVALAVFAFAPDTGAAFSHPSTSPAQAACGETLAGLSFAAGMMLHTSAAICLSQGANVELSGQRLYSLPEFDGYLAAAAVRSGRWGIGASFLSFGEPGLYLETTFSGHLACAVAKSLNFGLFFGHGRISLGGDYGAIGLPMFGGSIMFVPSSDWRAYASLKNPLEPEMAGGTRSRREINAGLAVTGFGNVGFAVEVNSISGENLRYKVGEVYRISPTVSLSAGAMTSPFALSFGCRFGLPRLDLLYAYRHHPELGGTHSWGITLHGH